MKVLWIPGKGNRNEKGDSILDPAMYRFLKKHVTHGVKKFIPNIDQKN